MITTEASELDVNHAVDLEWRKISDSGLLETMLSQVDSLHTSNSNNSGKYLKILFHLKKSYSKIFYLAHFKIVAFFLQVLYSMSNLLPFATCLVTSEKLSDSSRSRTSEQVFVRKSTLARKISGSLTQSPVFVHSRSR